MKLSLTFMVLIISNNYEVLNLIQLGWIVCKFRHPQETLNQLLLGLRSGNNPKCVITTTPKPLPFLYKLLKDSRVVVTKGTAYENKANFAKGFFKITHHFEGTRLGTQELYGQSYQKNKVLSEDVICSFIKNHLYQMVKG